MFVSKVIVKECYKGRVCCYYSCELQKRLFQAVYDRKPSLIPPSQDILVVAVDIIPSGLAYLPSDAAVRF